MIKLGYYFTESKYGSFFRQVKGYAPIFRASILDFVTSEVSAVEAKKKLRSALRKGNPKFILLTLNYNSGFAAESIRLVKSAGLWDKVIAIEVQDEPGWDAQTARRIVGKVFDILGDEKLSLPKYGLGVVEGIKGIISTNGWTQFGWVGAEAYVNPPGGTKKENRQALKKDMNRMMSRIESEGLDMFWVMQGYDRNGGWTNSRTRLALQSDTFRWMRTKALYPTIPITMIFSYARPGGTRDHPEMEETHRSYVYGMRTR